MRENISLRASVPAADVDEAAQAEARNVAAPSMASRKALAAPMRRTKLCRIIKRYGPKGLDCDRRETGAFKDILPFIFRLIPVRTRAIPRSLGLPDRTPALPNTA